MVHFASFEMPESSDTRHKLFTSTWYRTFTSTLCGIFTSIYGVWSIYLYM